MNLTHKPTYETKNNYNIHSLHVYFRFNYNEASISTKNIEALASSESINFECKTAGGICWKNNLPTYGIHFEVPEK